MCPFFCNHAAENVRQRDSLPDKVITNVWNIGDRNNEITGSRKQCSGSTWTAFACWGTSPPPKDQPCMLAICPKLCSSNGGGSIGFPWRGKCPKAWQGHRPGRFCNLKGKVRTSEWYILPLFSLVFVFTRLCIREPWKTEHTQIGPCNPFCRLDYWQTCFPGVQCT